MSKIGRKAAANRLRQSVSGYSRAMPCFESSQRKGPPVRVIEAAKRRELLVALSPDREPSESRRDT
jgi:hypothetical protein